MEDKQLLECLRPLNNDTLDLEPFEDYYRRIENILPNWPKCPLQNWLHRHYSYAVSDYAWLKFDKLHFELAVWDKHFIYDTVTTPKLEMLEGQGQQIFTSKGSRQTFLQGYMLENGTWPSPIIVLDNPTGILGRYGEKLGQPYHLLEGHLRLGYFRNIYRSEPDKLKPSHDIWLVRL